MLCSDGMPVLSPPLLLSAYGKGFFPMADEDGRIQWHHPDPRAVFPLERIRPNQRLKRFLRSAGFTMRIDTAFHAVMECCATAHGES